MRNQRQMVVRDHALANFKESFFLLMETQANLATWKYIAGCISALFLFMLNPLIEFNKNNLISIELTNNHSINLIWITILIFLLVAYGVCVFITMRYIRLQRNIFNNERGQLYE